MVVSTEARKYRKTVASLATAAGAQLFAGPLAMTLHLYRPRKAGDTSNRLKVVEDALQSVLYANDDQIVEHHLYRHDDKVNPRVELFLEERPCEEPPPIKTPRRRRLNTPSKATAASIPLAS